MTPQQKAARTIKQATIRTIAKNLGYSHLGLRLTKGQLKAAAKTLYNMRGK
jgi:hypothetical protein